MNDLELIFTMLGEASTTEIAQNKNAQGFTENKRVAQEGGVWLGRRAKIWRKKVEKKFQQVKIICQN